jgi:Ca2+/Na+ antiporter
MKITHTMIVMGVGSFLIQYFLMSPIMVNNRVDITNNLGKAYLSMTMALSMIFLEVMMHDHQYTVFSLNTYVILAALFVLFVYLYRNQVAINDKQYLEGMIEHHSMALLTSQEILKKTDDYNVSKLAKNIIQTQEDEIKIMHGLLEKKATNV